MMSIGISNRWIKGFNVSNKTGVDMEICHLLYVDDTVIFCEAAIAEQIFYI